MAKFEDRRPIKCSFCGKAQEQVKRLVAGPGVYICDECIALCNACQLNVVETITQSANSMNTISAFRKGKLDELRILVEELDADFVVFYNSLSVQMAERISAVAGCNVIDRTALILDIFSSRARSRQAKLQTEMARLQYDLPRLLNSDNDRERERGGGVPSTSKNTIFLSDVFLIETLFVFRITEPFTILVSNKFQFSYVVPSVSTRIDIWI